jgi:hypothetical protein
MVLLIGNNRIRRNRHLHRFSRDGVFANTEYSKPTKTRKLFEILGCIRGIQRQGGNGVAQLPLGSAPLEFGPTLTWISNSLCFFHIHSGLENFHRPSNTLFQGLAFATIGTSLPEPTNVKCIRSQRQFHLRLSDPYLGSRVSVPAALTICPIIVCVNKI